MYPFLDIHFIRKTYNIGISYFRCVISNFLDGVTFSHWLAYCVWPQSITLPLTLSIPHISRHDQIIWQVLQYMSASLFHNVCWPKINTFGLTSDFFRTVHTFMLLEYLSFYHPNISSKFKWFCDWLQLFIFVSKSYYLFILDKPNGLKGRQFW